MKTSFPSQNNQSLIEINTSRQFTSWLHEQNLSLVFTTYQAGKIFFIGLQANGQLSIFQRTLDRCMGLYAKGSSLYVSTLYQIWRFENTLRVGEVYQCPIHQDITKKNFGYTILVQENLAMWNWKQENLSP